MRKDPPFDMEYVYSTYLLEAAEREGARVFNRPRAIRDYNEKMAIAAFREFIAPTLVTRDTGLMRFASKPGPRVALSGRLGAPAQAMLRRSPSAGKRLAWHALRKRNAALADLHEVALAAERSQAP
jgi:glutathione synthase